MSSRKYENYFADEDQQMPGYDPEQETLDFMNKVLESLSQLALDISLLSERVKTLENNSKSGTAKSYQKKLSDQASAVASVSLRLAKLEEKSAQREEITLANETEGVVPSKELSTADYLRLSPAQLQSEMDKEEKKLFQQWKSELKKKSVDKYGYAQSSWGSEPHEAALARAQTIQDTTESASDPARDKKLKKMARKLATRKSQEFEKLWIKLNNSLFKTLSSQGMSTTEILKNMLRSVGIKNDVVALSKIGNSLLEIYVPVSKLDKVTGRLAQHRVEFETGLDQTAAPPYGPQGSRNIEIMVQRLAHLYENKKLLNLRECILRGLPLEIQDQIMKICLKKQKSSSATPAKLEISPTSENSGSQDQVMTESPPHVDHSETPLVPASTAPQTPPDPIRPPQLPAPSPPGGGNHGMLPATGGFNAATLDAEGQTFEWQTPRKRKPRKTKDQKMYDSDGNLRPEWIKEVSATLLAPRKHTRKRK